MRRHLILVGLPGAGKTTAGIRAAALLQTQFTDLDEMVEQEAGRPIAEIFARAGEPAFRRLERLAMERALAASAHLIAAGAGWIAQPGNLAWAAKACVVYLRVAPDRAAGRLGDAVTRPLLAGPDRAARMARLLGEREAWYRRAEAEVDATEDPEAVAELVAAVARRVAGW